ncbi:hypothetical protein NC651_012075 [Populus alba x Populus x berolinensis]|nr:hypothetical protein NC651_012075 [Populus alba x Populus x berolinensis]
MRERGPVFVTSFSPLCMIHHCSSWIHCSSRADPPWMVYLCNCLFFFNIFLGVSIFT